MAKHRWMGAIAGAAVMLGVTAPALAAQPSEQQVRQLFQVIHLDQRMMQMGKQLSGMMGRSLPCVPASYWEGFVDAASVNELMGRMIPIYQAHFTAEDVAGLLKFYRSPLGQKVITVMPKAMEEGMQVGKLWGSERAMAMIHALQQKGTLSAEGKCPASQPADGTALEPGK
ncbi:DUF2059 domain-containing protein [Rhodanobacter geophilus]|uniref:DUF2059 domain-containing protein n=1 Tax=Rhodanobacter geophilus TaxID=3162488 RepID=A0ABV3QN55_9GAMM